MAAEADWCGQCYAVPRPAPSAASIPPTSLAAPRAPTLSLPPAAGGASIMSPARTAQAQTAPPAAVKTRWRKTGTTFGPLGRVLATVALVVPFGLFVALGILTGGFTIAGAVIWGFVIMPWGLRDTWKAGQLPQR
jgi:hypothetical protein